MQTRDMYIPVGGIGFWQGAIRDLADPRYQPPGRRWNRDEWMVDLLYGDQEVASGHQPDPVPAQALAGAAQGRRLAAWAGFQRAGFQGAQ